MAGERTEAPTPKRLREARQKGNVSKSQELVSAGVLLAAVLVLRALGPGLWDGLAGVMRDGLANPGSEELTTGSVFAMYRDAGLRTLLLLAPLLGLLAAAGVAFNIAQTGLLLSSSGIQPKLSRINPGAGLKRLLSKDGLVNLVKALAKASAVAVVVWLTMASRLAEVASLGQLPIPEATGRLARLAFDVAIRAAVVLFLLAIADYAWQRRRHLQDLRMTREELKQEFRETEGDPQIKAAIRRRRQALLNRMIAAVPKADVVVTNPTHYAVALKYDPVTMGAPVVVAKGERLLAQRIKEVARQAGVPVLEEPPLARALYAAVPVGQHIPAHLFHAVAEVLAWVYSLRAKAPLIRAGRAAPQGAR
ncbi:MAG: flagellar biosynthesis protein FlhB [Dehalococcoidia bacterium]|nr:flagellar biosynthesis protein FlhB [Dehalococcoidia bacterium]